MLSELLEEFRLIPIVLRPPDFVADFDQQILGSYGSPVPLLDGEHVTDDAGTGFVHTAPSHGRDDFEIWTSNARDA